MKFLSLLLASIALGTTAMAQDTEVEDTTEQHSCCMNANFRHIMYVAPIQFTEHGVGFSLGYESKIGQSDIISWSLPVVATFNVSNDGEYYDQNNAQDAMFYVMPGIKIYPTGTKGMIKSAIGPSIIAGYGQQTESYYVMPYNPYSYPTLSTRTYETRDKFVFGAMLNYSLIISPTPRLAIGMDFGLGFSYLNMLDNVHQGTSGLVQGGFKMGYKF